MESFFAGDFYTLWKHLIVGIFLYVIIFALLKKFAFFEDTNINALIALLSALIVSFTGVLTFIISYAATWFAVLLILVFMIFFLLLFFGYSTDDLKNLVSPKVLAVVFGVLFLLILVQSFFAVYNTFSDPQNISEEVDTSNPFETNKIVEFFKGWFSNINSELLYGVLFLVIVGMLVIFLGKN